MADERGLFDLDEPYQPLSAAGDPQEKCATLIDFEMLRTDLVSALAYKSGSQDGRPPLGPSMMFKALILQARRNLCDPQAQFQIFHWHNFGRFLGLGDGGKVPDETTIQRCGAALTKAGAIKTLFEHFDTHLMTNGHL